MMGKLLFGLLVLTTLANGKPLRKGCKSDGDERWQWATGTSREDLMKFLESADIGFIRKFLANITIDFENALKEVRELEKIAEPFDANFTLNPRFEAALNKLESDEEKIEIDLESIPCLPKENLHFLDTCIQDAKDTDFNAIKEDYQLFNEVIHQVLVCSGSGLEVLIEKTDIESLQDSELTVKVLANRFIEFGEVSFEFAHLGKIMMEFMHRVYLKYAHGVSFTNNELVLGKGGDGKTRPGPNKQKIPDIDDTSANTDEDDEALERRVLIHLLKRLNKQTQQGYSTGRRVASVRGRLSNIDSVRSLFA